MNQQLYIVICETKNKKHIKRIYKTLDDCQHYLKELQYEVSHDRLGLYSLVSHSDTELIIEELDENASGAKSQRKYTVISGDVEDVLGQMLELVNDTANSLL